MSWLSREKKYNVFDFNEEDERAEKDSKRALGKFANPKKNQRQTSPVDKYKFLQCFAQGSKPQQKKISSEVIDIDAGVVQGAKIQQKGRFKNFLDTNNSGVGNQCPYSVSYAMDMPREDGFLREVTGLDTFSVSNSSNYWNEQVGIILDDDHCTEMDYSSTSSSPLSDNRVLLNEQLEERDSCGNEMDIINTMVVVFPDFIVYGGKVCTESRITFSCSSIKVEGSMVNGTKETFNFEWTIGDIINIQSAWFGGVKTAVVNLILKSKDSRGALNSNDIPGIQLLKFAVCDPCWSRRQEEVKSLDVRYKDKWNDNFDCEIKYDETALLSQKSRLPSMRYSIEFDEPFEDVIYPKGDPDAVLISKRDVELLEPKTFINDTIIDFYIKYLKNKIQPEQEHRFYFFNSFFFRKLADLDKDPSTACEGRAAFECVRKWTRNVNLFEKDYLFIPVNYSLHWSLIVICHPGEVACSKDDEIEKSPKVPCILHMDSIKGSHRGLKNLIKSYLCEEWKERHSNADDDVSSKFLHLLSMPLELPQQENSFDCGLFLLHYVELFLQEAPSNFNPFKITQFSNFLTRNWFHPVEASEKRVQIKRLIHEISEDHPHKEDSSAGCTDGHLSSPSLSDKIGKEPGEVFLGSVWSPRITIQQGFTSFSDAEKGTENSSLGASPQRDAQYTRDPEFIFRGQCQPGKSEGSFFDIRCHHANTSYPKSFMSPIKEAEETGEQMDYSPFNIDHFQKTPGLVTESSTISFVNKNGRVWQKPFCDQCLTPHFEVLDESTKGCWISSDIEVDEDQTIAEHAGSNLLETNDRPESSSTSNEGFSDFVVEDSQEGSSRIVAIVVEDSQEENGGIDALVIEDSEEENCTQDGKGNENSPSSFAGDTCTLPHGEHLTKIIDLEENTMPISNGVLVTKADDQQVVRR